MCLLVGLAATVTIMMLRPVWDYRQNCCDNQRNCDNILSSLLIINFEINRRESKQMATRCSPRTRDGTPRPSGEEPPAGYRPTGISGSHLPTLHPMQAKAALGERPPTAAGCTERASQQPFSDASLERGPATLSRPLAHHETARCRLSRVVADYRKA